MVLLQCQECPQEHDHQVQHFESRQEELAFRHGNEALHLFTRPILEKESWVGALGNESTL